MESVRGMEKVISQIPFESYLGRRLADILFVPAKIKFVHHFQTVAANIMKLVQACIFKSVNTLGWIQHAFALQLKYFVFYS